MTKNTNMKNWQNKELTQFLKERRHERTMEKVGTIIFTVLMTLAGLMLVHAWVISLTIR